MIGRTPDCVGAVALLLTVILLSSYTNAQPETILPPTNTLQVFALPVGQGDCTIIQCPNGNIIVYDCGSSGGAGRMVPPEVENWLDNSINNVAYILITHAHGDHHSYLPYIQWKYNNLQGIRIVGGQPSDYTGNTCNWLINNMHRVRLVNI